MTTTGGFRKYFRIDVAERESPVMGSLPLRSKIGILGANWHRGVEGL